MFMNIFGLFNPFTIIFYAFLSKYSGKKVSQTFYPTYMGNFCNNYPQNLSFDIQTVIATCAFRILLSSCQIKLAFSLLPTLEIKSSDGGIAI